MSAPRRLRSEYSKNGCKECKRRKIKCDEFINPPPEAIRKINKQGRVSCWQCTRLRKECEYPMKGEKVPRVSRKAMMEQKRKEEMEKNGQNGYLGYSDQNSALQSTLNGQATLNGQTLLLQQVPQNYGLQNGLSQSVSNLGHGGFQNPVPPQGYLSPMYFGQPVGYGMSYPGTGLGFSNPVAPVTGGLSNPNMSSSRSYGTANVSTSPGSNAISNGALPGLNLNPNSGMLNNSTAWKPSHPYLDQKPQIRGAQNQYFTPYTTKAEPPSASGSVTATSTTEPPEIEDRSLVPPPFDGVSFYEQLDLTLLAADLNNLVLDMIYELNPGPKGLTDLDSHPTPPTPTSEDNETNYYDYIPRNLGLGFIELRKPAEKVFLNEFYREFANIILPFNPYDSVARQHFNPARDILLKCAHREPFLLAAVLAQGARSIFTKLGKPEDEQAYYSYLLRCLKLLGPALGDAGGKMGHALVSNIEAVLLTVLLLTSSNAVNAKQNWRPHLRGAKDLLLKHNKNRPLTRKSKVLIFCKYWFVSFEILAGLGSKLGGTVHLDEELDLLLNYADPYEVQVLTELGLIMPNGFNLIGGYHNDCVPHLRDLIKLLNRCRKGLKPTESENKENGVSTADSSPGILSGKDVAGIQPTECIRLLGEFERQRNKIFFSETMVFSPDDFRNGVIPQDYLLDSAFVNGNRKIINWLDISQQLYCLAAHITILTDFLGVDHTSQAVQELIHRLLSLVKFVDTPVDDPVLYKYATLMVQWPVSVAGIHAVTSEDIATVERFFKAVSQVGSGSAGHTIKRIKRHWKRRELMLSDESEEDGLLDVVHY